MKVVQKEEFFDKLEEIFEDLPDRQKVLYLKELARAATKFTGGDVGRIGVWSVEIWPFGKKEHYKIW